MFRKTTIRKINKVVNSKISNRRKIQQLCYMKNICKDQRTEEYLVKQIEFLKDIIKR